MKRLCIGCALILGLGLLSFPQTPKLPVGYDAYDGWNAINGTTLSHDGVWLAYALVPEDGDGALVVRNLKSGAEHRLPRGRDPQFTSDGRFVVYAIAPTRAARDAAKKKKNAKPEDGPKSGMGIVNLATGEATTVDRVKSFKLAEEASTYLAYLMEAPPAARKSPVADASAADDTAAPSAKKKVEYGTDLIVRSLASGEIATLPGVTEYDWTRDGSHLAYAVSAKLDQQNGVYVWTAGAGLTGTPQPSLAGAGSYKQLVWNHAGSALAFVSTHDDAAANPALYGLYRAPAGGPAARIADASLAPGMSVSEYGTLQFSKDGNRLFFGIAERPRPEPKNAPEITKVDVWSWTDTELQPEQQVRAKQEAELSYRAVADLRSGKVETLGSVEVPDLMLASSDDAGANAVLSSDMPYRLAASWQQDYHDYYALDMSDGSHHKVLEHQHFAATLSPAGKYLLYFDAADNNWHTQRIADGRNFNLTGKLPVKFQTEWWDQPSPADPYGAGAWAVNDAGNDATVLLYDRYDIWAVAPDGSSARNLTGGLGRRQHLVFRYENLDPEAKTIPAHQPLLLSTTNDDTKATGLYRLASLTSTAPPTKVIMRDALMGRVLKAKNASTVVFTLGRFDQFPNLWTSDTNFPATTQVSDANPQQANYRWGKSELIDYVNRDGKPLRAILIKPDDFDPHKKYPMMVYIYERLTDTLHHYVAPAPGTSINLTRYVSHGYLVLEPDIAYDTGYPGDSALKCVLPAIERVEAMGFVDPARIGIQGHSWGGYQVAYMITRTNKFRAVEAGAVVADMISAYGGIRWGTGISRAAQYEHTQSRIGGPPWQDSLQYIENSPLFWVDKVQTPYLTIHNDGDDAVPWYQGIEFFTALRREHKPAWMFVFNGEKHGLRQRDNQKYWSVHLDEYFDHWLKDAPEPQWMKTGIPYLDRGQRDVDSLYSKQHP